MGIGHRRLTYAGLHLFNKDPEKGVDFFIQHGFIGSRSPSDVAESLIRYGHQLNFYYLFLNFTVNM